MNMLQGINGGLDEAENQIRDSEVKKEKNTHHNSKDKSESKKIRVV